MDKIVLYQQLQEAKKSLEKGVVTLITNQIREILSIDKTATHDIAILKNSIDRELKKLSLEIQGSIQDRGIAYHKVQKVPHVSEVLRAERLSENMSYTDRLTFILSPDDTYAKIDKQYIEKQKRAVGYKGKKKNYSAVEDTIRTTFLKNHFVLDTDKITDEMRLHLLDGKSIDAFISDPTLQDIKQKFTQPYFLQYELPSHTSPNKPEKKYTSRIMFFRGSPAIAVFRSADTHPIVSEPTKHEQRQIQKGMDMYMTNSSYDIITQQHKSIQHIIQNQGQITEFAQKLKYILTAIVSEQSSLDDRQKKEIELVMESLTDQVNPQVLMARLYNLTKIPYYNNRVVQENLLSAAIRRLDKRQANLGTYIYYMIPQLNALQTIHQQNIDNIERLHRNALMCASGNNPWSFVSDIHKNIGQFNKNNITDKIQRALHQHPLEQKDHLMGMFYTMHKQIGSILQIPDITERAKMMRIAVYSHRLVMAAQQLKQDIDLDTIQRPNIYVHTHFQEIRHDIHTAGFSQKDMDTFFLPLYEIMKNVDEYIRHKKLDLACEELSRFKEIVEPILEA